MSRTRLRFRGRRSWVPAVVALLFAAGLVYRATDAAFTGSTSNGGNAWTAGTVSLSNDAPSGAAVFTASNLKPGSTGTRCITITYTGTLGAEVRLYATDPTGSLGQYLDLTVTEGTGATDVNCTGFAALTTLSAGGETLASFATAHQAYAGGVSSWAPAGGTNETRSYRITWTLRDDNAAQGRSATVDLTWEARNT